MADVKISDLPTTGSAARTDYVETSDGSNSRRRTVAQIVGLTQQGDVSGLTAALAGKAASSHTHAQSDITNLTSDLSGKVGTSRNVSTQHSLTGGGNLSADRTLALVNDTASPGNNKVYGTDGSGARGWKDDPAGGAVDSVNGQTGAVVLDLEDVGASTFGAELAAVADAPAARTKIGVTAMAVLDDNEFVVGVTDDDPVPKTPAEVLAILGMASQAIPLSWELSEEAADGTYSFTCSMPRGGTVTGLTHVCASRSAGSIAVQIGGVNVTGLTSITPSTSKTTTSSSGANTFATGNEVTMVISGTSDITGLRVALNVTWG